MGTIGFPTFISMMILFGPLLFHLIRSLWRKEHRHLKPLFLSASKRHPGRSAGVDPVESDTELDVEEATSTRKPGTRPSAKLTLSSIIEAEEEEDKEIKSITTIFLRALRDLARSPPQYVVWVSVFVSIYCITRWTVEWLQWKHHPKPPSAHVQDVTMILVGAASILFLARGARHLENIRKLFVQIMFVVVSYTIAFQVSPNIKATLHPQGWEATIIVPIVLFLIALAFGYHILLAHCTLTRAYELLYVFTVGFVFVFHGTATMLMPQTKMHLHHYYWGWLCAHFMIFDTEASRLSQAYFIGISIHGIALFGAKPIFMPLE